jgi:hypothetical protein
MADGGHDPFAHLLGQDADARCVEHHRMIARDRDCLYPAG